MDLPLGPFLLQERIAKGGTSEIWGGVHVAQNIPVAIKLLTGRRARTPAFYVHFWREVQAAARLTHPHTVTIFDYGTVTSLLEERTGGRLVQDSPYIAMEYAAGGTLANDVGQLRWEELRSILLDLLRALAHAHTHGIVHRDIKPANILCFPQGTRRVFKLSDFGIAHATPHHFEETPETSEHQRPIGTLRYMAPEQFQGDASAFGPWTDLYALGITAYELVNGHPPFAGNSFASLARHHMSSALPAFALSAQCPDAFEGWIRRMTAKAPLSRFRYAADAARALEELEFPPVNVARDRAAPRVVWAQSAPRASADAAHTLDTCSTAPGDDEAVNVRWSQPLPLETSRAQPPASQATVPARWQRATSSPSTPIHLLGAGLSLYGLRTPPLVGRLELRDALWGALRRVQQRRRPYLVTLRGLEGVGKSRLASWLGERAEEVGVARRLRATFDLHHSANASLTRMIERARRSTQYLGGEGGGRSHAAEFRALLEEIAPGSSGRDAAPVRFQSMRERYVVIWRALAQLAAERPVVVWLDDVHNSPDFIRFFEYVLQDGERAPVLFVATANDALLVEHRDVIIDDLPTRGGGLDLEVQPLDEADARALVSALLGLTNPLVDHVCARVEGNPLFAVRIVDDWVGRGVLEASAAGFRLKAHVEATIPDSLHSLAQQAVQRVLEALPADARDVLELAALLGRGVDDQELARAASTAGVAVPAGLGERLQRYRLADVTERGWDFEHALFQESIERSAREGGRLPSLHAAIAHALEALYPNPTPGVLGRRAHHLIEAGQAGEALPSLLAAAEGFIAVSAFRDAHVQLDRHARVLDGLGSAPTDARLRNTLLRANAFCVQWKLDDALAHATQAEALAEAAGDELLRANALTLLAHVDRHHGDLDRATDRALEALEIFERHDDAAGVAQTRLSLAILTRVGVDARASVALYEAAHRDFEAIDNTSMAAQCLYGLGNVYRQLQDYPRARALYERAAVGLEAAGNRHALAECLNGMADIDRYAGDLARAEEGYQRAYALMRGVGSRNAAIAQLNLGLGLVGGGRDEEARAIFEQILLETTQPTFVAMAHALLLVCLTGAGDEADFDHHAAEAGRLLRETSTADPDIANLTQTTADRLERRGDSARTRVALELTLEQWSNLNDLERAQIVRERLANGTT